MKSRHSCVLLLQRRQLQLYETTAVAGEEEILHVHAEEEGKKRRRNRRA